MRNVMVLDNYISCSECDELYNLFHETEVIPNHSDGVWANRVKWPTYSEYYKKKLDIDRTILCEQFFNKKFKIDNLNMTLWKEGHEMHPHSDYGGSNEYPHREYASIIYLNDNYQGGEIYIPELKFELKPKKGQLVCFQGGKYMHGVKKILKGERLTSICWFQEIR